ncbi:MAG: glucose-1-phosphate thymidylyltransferase [Cytophagales bacterium]|nr:MAG: glucose-1-phosphate thymidylyltransferase [Cytophagales bacterium]TAF60777.1 MAG: glucose-1-phosphate thymidylyltransferase [Cytophagales bacterium]
MLILADSPAISIALRPLTALKAIASLRVGIFSIQEKWIQISKHKCLIQTSAHLQPLYNAQPQGGIYINSAICPSLDIWNAIQNLQQEEALVQEEQLIAWKTNAAFADTQELYTAWLKVRNKKSLALPHQAMRFLLRPWHIFLYNRAELIADFERITKGRRSAPIQDPHTQVYNPSQIFLEEGASVLASTLNADKGPIYLARGARIEEGCIVRGAAALGEGATLNCGTKLRGDSTIGPFCKVGGEVSNVVFQAYSNKGHEGFLGNALVGEWCNLGALTTGSNLKNNYSSVKVWSDLEKTTIDSGQLFCGPIIGDHAKTAIGVMLNTGCVLGTAANVIETDFKCKYFEPFLWHRGVHKTFNRWQDFLQTLDTVMKRRVQTLTPEYIKALKAEFDMAKATQTN